MIPRFSPYILSAGAISRDKQVIGIDENLNFNVSIYAPIQGVTAATPDNTLSSETKDDIRFAAAFVAGGAALFLGERGPYKGGFAKPAIMALAITKLTHLDPVFDEFNETARAMSVYLPTLQRRIVLEQYWIWSGWSWWVIAISFFVSFVGPFVFFLYIGGAPIFGWENNFYEEE